MVPEVMGCHDDNDPRDTVCCGAATPGLHTHFDGFARAFFPDPVIRPFRFGEYRFVHEGPLRVGSGLSARERSLAKADTPLAT
jgi:hypothetical protein